MPAASSPGQQWAGVRMDELRFGRDSGGRWWRNIQGSALVALNGAGIMKHVYTYLLAISLLIPDPLAAVCLDGTLSGV